MCVVQWAEVTTTCPMCKTNFTTLIHNVEAIDKYAQYKVEPKTKSSGFEIGIGGARRFRYRTTLMPGQPRAASSSGGAGSSHSQEEGGATERERERRERREEAAQQMSNPASDERRRVVYALGLWAQPSANSDRRKERVRDICAMFFRQNPACTHRLVPWLTREFKVLLGPEHVQFMIQLVLSLLSKINLDGEEFPEHLQPFLATRTSHFLHELVSFARSPLNMAAYDHSVRYEWPTAGRARDNWDPEATVNHSILPQHLHSSPTPGPAGLSSQEIQERLFHELTATRWDDSPPFLPLPSSPSSPILVHGSDSECDGVDDVAPSIAASPLEASSSNLAAISSGAIGDGAAVSVGRGEEGGREGEEGDFGTGVASETLSQQPRSLEDGDYPTLEGLGSQALEDTFSTHPPADTESPASLPSSLNTGTETNKHGEEVNDEKEKEQRNKEGEDGIEEEEECIVINAESEGEQPPEQRANETFGSIAAGSLETRGTKRSFRKKPTSCPREGKWKWRN
ncbi:E3 ubiquitin-protein ligase Topors [Geodia barretti]|uniref:RING-type E3 ubiquitin transferase n=1 Tax=Geodia barretti TaxID=519541 RepID=A0AA35XDB0_GEOBA|nr:E3 ubiquitin-protein ligase Topors [Geodia barretti]